MTTFTAEHRTRAKEIAERWHEKYARGVPLHSCMQQAVEDGMMFALSPTQPEGPKELRERIKRTIMLKVQGNQLGHWDYKYHGGVAVIAEPVFVTTNAELDTLDRVCSEAADALLASGIIPTQKAGEALADIAAERQRQIDKEGWSREHDDEHDTGALAKAAACYARHGAQILYARCPVPDDFPWPETAWKPKNARRDLVRAAAMLVAEIERIDRKNDLDRRTAPRHQRPMLRRPLGVSPTPSGPKAEGEGS